MNINKILFIKLNSNSTHFRLKNFSVLQTSKLNFYMFIIEFSLTWIDLSRNKRKLSLLLSER